MKILLTGVTGYIGKRLLPLLLESGHEVICCTRDINRFHEDDYPYEKTLKEVEVDFLKKETLDALPKDIDAAYYLIHSMSQSLNQYQALEEKCAENFKTYIESTTAQQVIYLSGIVNADILSPHLQSRLQVEKILSDSNSYALTTIRAGIIVGSGSASFEIIRDLVEKLPIMVAPKWINTKSQPIAIKNILEYLQGVLLLKETFNNSYDVGGPRVMPYKDMILEFGEARGLKRWIFSLPIMTPRLSSYWLYFVTSTSYPLAVNLVKSMEVEVVPKQNDLHKKLGITLLTYKEAILSAFGTIEQQEVISRWTDALSSKKVAKGLDFFLNVPSFGCFKDRRSLPTMNESKSLQKIFSIGGSNGWYYANLLWEVRGILDKMVGGVGLRRGRKNPDHISAGESLDFWRVIYASEDTKRLLLYAEMKLPGEAWLEFVVRNDKVYQTATFRPKGILGRLYWYSVLPFHGFIFKGMLRKIANA